MSQGDEASVAGGVMSGQIGVGSTRVLVEGQGVIYQTAVLGHNGNNANAPAGIQQTPSQTKVIVST